MTAGRIVWLLCAAAGAAELPGTTPWDFPKDIVAEQYLELRQYYERELARAASRRGRYWQRAEWQSNREELRRLLGVVDPLIAPKPDTTPLEGGGAFSVSLVEWPILRLGNSGSTGGFSGAMVREYGLLLAPKSPGRHPATIVLGDAGQFAQLAEAGHVVFAPFLIERRTFSQPWTEDRSWLFRLGYQVGRHLIGSEVQQVSSAYDFLAGLADVDAARIGVAGGLTALYAAALDTRLAAARVWNDFDNRTRAFDEPEDRAIWNMAERFGDAEIGALVAPRRLAIEGGGPGAREEFERLRAHYQRHGAAGQVTLSAAPKAAAAAPPKLDPERTARIANAQFAQWQARFRNLAMEAYTTREAAWRTEAASAEEFERWVQPKREAYFDLTGRYPASSGPLDARSVQIYDEPDFTGYRLRVRVYDGVHAYGILLVPKRIAPGERRGVVFTQHGLAGTPEDALGVVPNAKADDVYQRFGMRLARRGYVVFAPMISVQVEPERYAVARRAHLLGLTPVGLEARKFARVLDYLETLPFVDKRRFGFYGLSYGGYTALWAGPAEPRFKVVINSGHYNDWNLKTTDLTEGTSFLFYKNAFDMFQFGVLQSLSHSELAMLIAPRACLIEIGDRDGIVIAPRRFADLEMQRVEDLYRRLGIPEKGRVARFDGPHRIDGKEAFEFLDRWLK